MSPVLGIIASGISGHLTPVYDPSSYDALATAIVPSGGLASVNFAGIPTGYKHLQIRVLARSTDANTANYLNLKLNSDTTGSNYSRHLLVGNGTSAASYNSTGGSTITNLGEIPAANATSGMFGVFIVDILDYANISKNKTVRSLGGDDRNGGGEVELNSISYMSLNAVTSLQFTTYAAGSIAQNSHFALYGVK